jgi:hypothetical protein
MTFVASNASTGSYFTILKSGIWSISAIIANADAAQYVSLDASTNTTFSGHMDNTGTICVGHTSFGGQVNFTGYLSSNASMHYKFHAPIANFAAPANKLMISFICELPDISPTFPPP